MKSAPERIDVAIKSLEEEKASLSLEVESKATELREAQAKLKQVERALSSLNGNGQTNGKPAPTKAAVLNAVTNLLKENDGTLEEDELRELTRTAILEAGMNELGFALRFSEALQVPGIVMDGTTVRLADVTDDSEQPPFEPDE